MRIKAICRSESGSVYLIVNEYDSMEDARKQLEFEGYYVSSLSLADDNEYELKL